ncbi:poly(ADP-ribose) glycohydrolase 1 isoform X4 [Neltuma alba]|uniref:poly(ADP-ribose) glycohydrolase 1 isoform X1 n=1 Tax=Neltuma alba TaxID=207710 RepID=UPI0010A30B0F|nr:poly(ADP-ribose) glycohydrolase 1-like isoform X1 [Prosopis alba]XP_028793584.1 poly(ADP-ribose) glycohydrolase 1-like isoform X4 [Prosopis alba]
MEDREDLRSILPFLPLLLRSSSLFWPSQVVEALKALGRGPLHSQVDSGELLFLAISDLRNSLCLCTQPLAPSASQGYAFFFDELMSGVESKKWFEEVIPALANLLLRFPSLLEEHYQSTDMIVDGEGGAGLRLLESQEAGIVFLRQELVAALLCCSLFCLFPDDNRTYKDLPPINFDELFASGVIEDQSGGALEVDFANKYLGGGALRRGCVQEEIRFMVSPELIVGMLFLPSMAENEAIEIVGVERFSSYTGYASSFRFSGGYVDKRDIDELGRRKTRIVAIDALCGPGMRQYREKFLLREINKAFCGFLSQTTHQPCRKILQDNRSSELVYASTSTSVEVSKVQSADEAFRNSPKSCHGEEQHDSIGVATGNWGCGAFGGDPEVKTIIQWLAASQALRPFIAYYTFGSEALRHLDQVADWILSHQWTVGDLWNMLIEYSTLRWKGETNVGFFKWLLPSIHKHDAGMD